MTGGGKWENQNKILPGTYINFVSGDDEEETSSILGGGGISGESSSVFGICMIGEMIIGQNDV